MFFFLDQEEQKRGSTTFRAGAIALILGVIFRANSREFLSYAPSGLANPSANGPNIPS